MRKVPHCIAVEFSEDPAGVSEICEMSTLSTLTKAAPSEIDISVDKAFTEILNKDGRRFVLYRRVE